MRSSFRLVETFTLGLSILEPIYWGGMVSLLPPTGEPTLAQDQSNRLVIRIKTSFFIMGQNYKIYDLGSSRT